jgi:predicted HicB family RNase H-like nuclease
LPNTDESNFVEVLVDLPDDLQAAAQLEAKRLGVTLEQWVSQAVANALSEEKAEQKVSE